MFGFIEVDSANFQIDGGTINNSATIDLTPSSNVTTDLTIFNTVQLNGAGSIVFAGDGNDGILGGTSAASLTNFDNNISGTGFIEGLVFTNYATIETNNSLGAGTLRIVGSAYGGSFETQVCCWPITAAPSSSAIGREPRRRRSSSTMAR